MLITVAGHCPYSFSVAPEVVRGRTSVILISEQNTDDPWCSFPLDAPFEAHRFAGEFGLHRTAHAGEACGPESVWETLRVLDPTRIGHGTRRIEDPDLVNYLRDMCIHLELCPSANVQIIPSLKAGRRIPSTS